MHANYPLVVSRRDILFCIHTYSQVSANSRIDNGLKMVEKYFTRRSKNGESAPFGYVAPVPEYRFTPEGKLPNVSMKLCRIGYHTDY